MKTNSEYLIRYLDKAIKPLVSIMPKMSGYVKTFKVKDGDKGKYNKMIFSVQMKKNYQKNIKLFGIRLNI